MDIRELSIAYPRLLLGPGPSPVPYRVRRAMAEPVLGHMDPQFLAIVDEVQEMLRQVFGTENRLTLPVSGTGSAGMETALMNFVEPGDSVLVVSVGLFGRRIQEAAIKLGADVIELSGPWGQAISLDQIHDALRRHPDIRVVAVVKAETSTGVFQDLTGWAEEVHRHDALLLVDAVTALGGMPVDVDREDLDIVFSGTQKCLSAPPGLAPFTAGRRAEERLDARTRPVSSWYLDLNQVRQYWGTDRTYHHTAPISMIYGLHEALRMTLEEGLAVRYRRHRRVAQSLWAGLEAMGLDLFVEPSCRLNTVTTVRIPDSVQDKRVRAQLLEEGIEIAGGLGPLAGKIWRIGVMGHGAYFSHMLRLLAALQQALQREGCTVASGLDAAERTYSTGYEE